MAQQTYVEPIKYVVGKDIPEARYQEALLKIADWFAESRDTQEPALLAKQALQECLDGVTKEGQKWFSAALTPLAKRVRMKCRFDIDLMVPIRTGSEKSRKKRASERARDLKRRRERGEDTLIPEEVRKDLANSVTYGTDPHLLLSTQEQRHWNELRGEYVRQHPELGTVSARAELALLCDLHILSERHRLKLLQGKEVYPSERTAVVETLAKIKQSLGIHPDQLAKRAKVKEDTSIGAAAARLESMGNYRELRQRFWVEELLQVYQMFMTVSADGQAYQLDEVGLFGVTRSRPCLCPKCGTRVFAGLSIEEIEAYLIQQGVLVPVPEVPADATTQAPPAA